MPTQSLRPTYVLQVGVAAPPRCSAHRDFSPATLIWAGGEGLEVK